VEREREREMERETARARASAYKHLVGEHPLSTAPSLPAQPSAGYGFRRRPPSSVYSVETREGGGWGWGGEDDAADADYSTDETSRLWTLEGSSGPDTPKEKGKGKERGNGW
jgi:hypothetical protein